MIKLEGIVFKRLYTAGGKDKKQVINLQTVTRCKFLGAMDLPNGDVKNELFTLSVENYRDFSDFLNQKSHSCWSNGNGPQRDFYVAKGANPS